MFLVCAAVLTDEMAQVISIDECQYVITVGSLKEVDIIEWDAVINGTHPGRISEDENTLFDGAGVGLQDLAVASAAGDLAIEKNVATEMDF